MNSISWLIYLSNVVSNIGPVIVVFGVSMLVASVVTVFAETHKNDLFRLSYGVKYFVVAFTAFCIAAFVPSQKTVLMIAASEAASAAVQSEIGQNSLNLLNEEIKKRLSDLNRSNQSNR